MPSDKRQQASASPQTAARHPRAYSLGIRGSTSTIHCQVKSPLHHISRSPRTHDSYCHHPPSLPDTGPRPPESHEPRAARRPVRAPPDTAVARRLPRLSSPPKSEPSRASTFPRATRTSYALLEPNEAFDTQLSPARPPPENSNDGQGRDAAGRRRRRLRLHLQGVARGAGLGVR